MNSLLASCGKKWSTLDSNTTSVEEVKNINQQQNTQVSFLVKYGQFTGRGHCNCWYDIEIKAI